MNNHTECKAQTRYLSSGYRSEGWVTNAIPIVFPWKYSRNEACRLKIHFLLFLRLLPFIPNFLFFGVVSVALAEASESKQSVAPEIVLDQTSVDIFPESWRTAKVDAKAEPLADADKARSRMLVQRALKVYPPTLLNKYLKKIYVVGGLQYSGVATAGTRSASSVYLVVNDRYTSELAEKNLHAEFSSILFLKCPQYFDQVAWCSVNPPAFTYHGGGVRAVKAGQASNRFKESLHEIGFLHDYGQASVEEDFNSYAARLLVGDDALWNAIERYPKVQTKAELAMGFYFKLDPTFSKEFFISLRRSSATLPMSKP